MLAHFKHVCLVAVAMIIVGITKLLYKYYFPYYVKNVKILKNTSILGYEAPFISLKKSFDSHVTLLNVAETQGKMQQFYFLGHLILLVHDKNIIKYLLDNVHGKGFFQRGHPKLNHKSIFNLDTNSDWKVRRNAFRHAFSVNSLRNFQDLVKVLCEKISDILDVASNDNTVVELDTIFGRLTVDVICKLAFQLEIDAMGNSTLFQKMHNAIRNRLEMFWVTYLPYAHLLLKYFSNLKIWKKYTQSRKDVTEFNDMIYNHLQELQKKGELNSHGLAASLMEFDLQPGVTKLDTYEEFTTMFIAGHETTAHTLSWFVYSLAKHPDIQLKCQQSIDEWTRDNSNNSSNNNVVNAEIDPMLAAAAANKEIANNNNNTTTSTTDSNTSTVKSKVSYTLPPYVEAVLKESMRKYPVANRGSKRLVTAKDGITIPMSVLNANKNSTGAPYTSDVHLPKGIWVQTCFQTLHTSTMNWGKNADQFIPERWLSNGHFSGDSSLNTTGMNNPLSSAVSYAGIGMSNDEILFAPFSSGLRNCIGMNLALMEIRMAILELVKKFHFTLADDSLMNDQVAMETVFTMRPKDYLPVKVNKALIYISEFL